MSRSDMPVLPEAGPSTNLSRYMMGGFLVVLVLFAGVGGWAATAPLAGAVIAPGTVVVDSNVKKVQHPTGGVVGRILVKDGDYVKTGDLLVRLDETVTRANLQMISKQIDELAIRTTRLKAERDDAAGFQMPDALVPRRAELEIADIYHGEQSLFSSRRKTSTGEKAQLQERIAQLKEEIAGLVAQKESKATEIELIGKELTGLETLEAKQLVTTTKMVALRREAARLEGERAQLQASAAQSKGKIAEIELHMLQREQELKTEIVKELREGQSKMTELTERAVAAEDQLKRIEIRAPQAGYVHQLAVHTVGGVINPSEPLMLIVPGGDKLVVEAKIDPLNIEQVRLGAGATVRFSAFNSRTTPEIFGTVSRIAADLTHEERTGLSYFLVRVAITDEELAKLGDGKLIPGMPADVQIKTEDRTALSYLWKPIEDQFSKAFRER
jgi:HlyD family secretion protein